MVGFFQSPNIFSPRAAGEVEVSEKVRVPTVEERQTTLARVNEEFFKRGLLQWQNHERLGHFMRDEHQIIDVIKSEAVFEGDDKRIAVSFRTILPLSIREYSCNAYGYYRMEFSAPIGAIVVLWRDHVILNKQHRLTKGEWRYEVPRAWIDKPESAEPERAARYLLSKEFGPEWAKSVHMDTCIKVEEVDENTGERVTPLCVYLVRLSDDGPRPTKTFLGQKPYLVTWKEFCEMRFRDLHSRGAREGVRDWIADNGMV